MRKESLTIVGMYEYCDRHNLYYVIGDKTSGLDIVSEFVNYFTNQSINSK